MTNYNDGNWWGWNGGECPIHPKSVVEAIGYRDSAKPPATMTNWSAGDFHWSSFRGAFRVVKEHREPVEVWLLEDVNGRFHETVSTTIGARLFREVIE